MSTSTFEVCTKGAGLTRTGNIPAESKAKAIDKAISDHRARLLELATSTIPTGNVAIEVFNENKRRAVVFAQTSTILVSNIKVVEFEVGDGFLPPKDAA